MAKKNDFAIKTVKNGTVTIGWKVYRPREFYAVRDDVDVWYKDYLYNDELEGLTFVFGRYRIGNGFEEYVSLWSSVAYFNADIETRIKIAKDEPNLIGSEYCWDWWVTENQWQKTLAKLTPNDIQAIKQTEGDS